MMHFYFTGHSPGTEGLSRLVCLTQRFFSPRCEHEMGFAGVTGDYAGTAFEMVRPPERPNHALDLGGIHLGGMDIVSVPDLIPWVHPREFTQVSGLKQSPLTVGIPRFHTGLKSARCVVGVSHESKRQLGVLGYPCHEVIHPPLEPALDGLSRSRETRPRSGFLLVGSNDPRKRSEVAVRAAAAQGQPLTWIGTRLRRPPSEAYDAKVGELARYLGVDYRRVPGAGDALLVEAYRRHSVLLVPSLWEGYCLPIPEALAFGCPVVALDTEEDGPRPDPWVQTIYKGHIPLAHSYDEIPSLAEYDAREVFDELDDMFCLTRYEEYVEKWLRLYERVGDSEPRTESAAGKVRFNVGCGRRKLAGYVNVDIDPSLGPDMTFDLSQRWPLPDGCADEIRAYHVLEHLPDPLHAAREASRMLRPGGRLVVQLPHDDSPDSTRDWSHVNPHWNRKRMEWLAHPTEYVGDLGFKLEDYREDRGGWLLHRKNLTARYVKDVALGRALGVEVSPLLRLVGTPTRSTVVEERERGKRIGPCK